MEQRYLERRRSVVEVPIRRRVRTTTEANCRPEPVREPFRYVRCASVRRRRRSIAFHSAHNAIHPPADPTTPPSRRERPYPPPSPARRSTRQCDNTADRPPTAIIAHTYYIHWRTHARTHAHARAHYYRYLSAADGYGGDDKVAAAASYGVYLYIIVIYARQRRQTTNRPRPPVTAAILYRLPLPASAHRHAKHRHRRHRPPSPTLP